MTVLNKMLKTITVNIPGLPILSKVMTEEVISSQFDSLLRSDQRQVNSST